MRSIVHGKEEKGDDRSGVFFCECDWSLDLKRATMYSTAENEVQQAIFLNCRGDPLSI
jgi:hypothetical protein